MDESIPDKQGVYYLDHDYANIWVRTISWIIDLVALSVIISILWSSTFFIIEDESVAIKIAFLCSVLISYSYLAILKASHVGTVGFRLTQIKIVNLHGLKPSWVTMMIATLWPPYLGLRSHP